MVRLQATLKVLPQQVDTPTLNSINPLYSILSHVKGQLATCKQAISTVSQELLTLSLLVPGVSDVCHCTYWLCISLLLAND